ncbi:nuclear transport factor 2 family protein [Cohnella herbarum]|uniref:Nuclear transport factor 2 family protein n=1 Tax=Cohnella herbarum TaxID=2728023 RepID=A0A7Z2ZKC1_9BACL|nr:nuclear transport factor 2 family protein [Cohnella herbarum]QJD82685.1 nuclear transport factor 2 family protein [Cohnella herbarum]
MTFICSETKEIIDTYVEAYNSLDVPGMINLLHKDILFRNFSNGVVNVETHGVQEFRKLAENSTKIFSSRRQTIIDWRAIDGKIEAIIDYEGILAVDLPNGLIAGDRMQLKGKSVFRIEEGKISLIEDYG